jgi:aminomuconate-semialdehyde/2-hydroxymuconate-6-semialdehyde dehydrogenase
MLKIPNFIAGEFREPASASFHDNVDPATGQVYSRVADSDGRDVDVAVHAAQQAFPAWSQTPVAERSRLLLAVAQCIDDNLDRLAQAECVDTGKPLRLARTVDIPRAAANFRFFATARPTGPISSR